MLIQVQPGQAVVGPDMAFGRRLFGMVEGGDGHVDARRAQVGHQRQLRAAVPAEVSCAGG